MGRWFAEHGAKIGHGNQLQPPQTATTVRFQDNGEPIIHDGAFIEGNEVVGGTIPDLTQTFEEFAAGLKAFAEQA